MRPSVCHPERKHYAFGMCHPCYKLDWQRKHPQFQRNWWLKYSYGITEADYQNMLQTQGGGCGICDSKTPHLKGHTHLLVDHNHQTNRVRGLLCNRCNIKLDWALRNQERIAQYMAGTRRTL